VRPIEQRRGPTCPAARSIAASPNRYLHRDGSGRHIALFFYDGPASRSIAFEGTLVSSQTYVGRIAAGRGGPGRLIHVATDGESYGHHFRHGELTLAHALAVEGPAHAASPSPITARFWRKNPPTMEVEIAAGPSGEGTSWSCAHGVGRWYRDCGCNTDNKEGWNQAWRTPLRQALDLLHDEADSQFEEQVSELLRDPWAARERLHRRLRRPEPPRRLALDPPQEGPQRRAESARAHLPRARAQHAVHVHEAAAGSSPDLGGNRAAPDHDYAGHALGLMDDLGLVSPRERFSRMLAEAKSTR